MKIGLLGADINNTNLGCQALTWSLLAILEKIRTKNSMTFHYFVFEANPEEHKVRQLVHELDIPIDIIHTVHLGCITDPLRAIKYARRNVNVLKKIKECDILFDITRGDSFSDIYGTLVFNTFAKYKFYAEKVGVPLVLAPQTYGPFLKKKNIYFAKKIFENADYIFSRDKLSDELVKSLCGKNTIVTTDVAFQLPFSNIRCQSECIKIGINISGLLAVEKKNEYNQNLSYSKKYNNLLSMVLDWISKQEKYELYFIPHVTNDIDAIKFYSKKYPKAIIIDYIDNPKRIKEEISKMDIFIGSRMHATIAALSSGVVTIPIAYSRKFKGVFDLIKYPYTIELDWPLEEMYKKTINCIEQCDNMREKMFQTYELIEMYNQKSNNSIEAIINKYYK